MSKNIREEEKGRNDRFFDPSHMYVQFQLIQQSQITVRSQNIPGFGPKIFARSLGNETIDILHLSLSEQSLIYYPRFTNYYVTIFPSLRQGMPKAFTIHHGMPRKPEKLIESSLPPLRMFESEQLSSKKTTWKIFALLKRRPVARERDENGPLGERKRERKRKKQRKKKENRKRVRILQIIP